MRLQPDIIEADPPLISVVIPVFNEEGNLPLLRERLQKTLSEITDSWEIIFVNDASTDSSANLIKNFRNNDKRIHYLTLSRNFGHQAALTAGLSRASGRAVITMDADLQDPPELISELIQKWNYGKDAKIVHAIPYKKRGISFYKKGTSSLYYKILSKISGIPAPPPGDFRLIDHDVLTLLNNMPEHSRFIRGIISWVGFNKSEIKFERPPRFSGSSKYSTPMMLKLAMDGITSFSTAPLRIASYFGFGCAFISFLYAARILILKAFRGTPVQLKGWTSLIVTILFLGGIQLITIGIIGEYIGRMGEEVKNRPRFIIMEEE